MRILKIFERMIIHPLYDKNIEKYYIRSRKLREINNRSDIKYINDKLENINKLLKLI